MRARPDCEEAHPSRIRADLPVQILLDMMSTIGEQRIQIDGILERSPRLMVSFLAEMLSIYRKAARQASDETGLSSSTFVRTSGVEGEPIHLDVLLSAKPLPQRMDDLFHADEETLRSRA